MGGAVTRTVSVLFTDLVGSTVQSGSLRPDQADDLRRVHLQLMERAAQDASGTVVKNLGDGVMVTFESTASAVACAVAMQQAIHRHNSLAADDSARDAYRASLGEATHEDGDWFGTPVVEAARLCAAADGGQILTTDVVRSLLAGRGDQQFKPLGLRDLKGLPEPVPVCEVVWEPKAPPTHELPPILADDVRRRGFVGRVAELDRLQAAWERARMGERKLVLVAGEPGIGKTRLVSEVARHAHVQGAVVLFGRCHEELLSPYQPFAEAMRNRGQDLGRLAPESVTRPVDQSPMQLPGDDTRYQLFDGVAAWLANLTETEPVVLVLDDLHWADKPTLLLLEYLMRLPGGIPLLVLGTYRETDLARSHPLSAMLGNLRRERLYDRVMLRGLDEVELRALITDRAGHEPPAAFTHAVHVETEGNPFFAEEVLLHLSETGAIYERDGRWVSDATSIEQLGIPEGVREVIGRRLSHISDTANKLLGVASVLGREFSVNVAENVGTFASDEMLDALDECRAARILVEVPNDPDRYAFSHALIRQTCYDELSSARRLRLHQRAGEVLETRHAADPGAYLSELAYHFSQLAYGGDPDKAISYCVQAAERSMLVFAYEEAVLQYSRALQVLEIADRAGGREEYELRMSLVNVLRHAQEVSVQRREALAAAELARALGDMPAFAKAVAEVPFAVDDERSDLDLVLNAITHADPHDRVVEALLRSQVATRMQFFPEFADDEVASAMDAAVDAARETGDVHALTDALWMASTPLLHSPDIERRAAHSAELSTLARATPGPFVVNAARHLVVLHALICGDLAAVEDTIADLDEEVGTRTHGYTAANVAKSRAILLLLRGRFADAETMAFRAYEAGRAVMPGSSLEVLGLQMFALRRDQGRLAEMEEPLRRRLGSLANNVMGIGMRGGLIEVLVELDRLDEAAVEVEQLRSEHAHERKLAGVITLTLLAEAVAALRDRDFARELYERILPWDGQTVVVTLGPAYCNGAVSRYLGLLATTLGEREMAEHHFRDAMTMNERLGARPWVARTQLDHARMLTELGTQADTGRARELASAALATADELGMAAVAGRARVLLG